MRVTPRPNTAEKTPPIDLDRASQIEIERPNETREQRRNSTKGSCRKTRTNTAADRPPDAKKFGNTQNPVISGNPSPRTQPGRGVTPLRGHRPQAQLTHSQTHSHTHREMPERDFTSVYGASAAIMRSPRSPGWAIRRAQREVDQLIVPTRLRPTSVQPKAGTKGPGSTADETTFVSFVSVCYVLCGACQAQAGPQQADRQPASRPPGSGHLGPGHSRQAARQDHRQPGKAQPGTRKKQEWPTGMAK